MEAIDPSASRDESECDESTPPNPGERCDPADCARIRCFIRSGGTTRAEVFADPTMDGSAEIGARTDRGPARLAERADVRHAEVADHGMAERPDPVGAKGACRSLAEIRARQLLSSGAANHLPGLSDLQEEMLQLRSTGPDGPVGDRPLPALCVSGRGACVRPRMLPGLARDGSAARSIGTRHGDLHLGERLHGTHHLSPHR